MPTKSARAPTFLGFLNSIVASSGPRPPTIIAVECEGPSFNFARSINCGINRALEFSPKTIIMSNDDMRFKLGQVSHMAESLWKAPNVAYAVPLIVSPHSQLQSGVVMVPNPLLLYPFLTFYGLIPSFLLDHLGGFGIVQTSPVLARQFRTFKRRRLLPLIVTIASLQPLSIVRADVLEDVGLYDVGYWNGLEDVDLSLRIVLKGYRVLIDNHITTTHLGSETGGQGWNSLIGKGRLGGERTLNNWKRFVTKFPPPVFRRANDLLRQNTVIVS